MTRFLVAAAALALVGCAAEDADIDNSTINEANGFDGAVGNVVQGKGERGSVAPAKPVMFGGEADFDACGSFGRIAEGQAVTVRSADDASADAVATLQPGHGVAVCDQDDGNIWYGIVFDPAAPDSPDCGTGTPVAERRAYDGVCKSGWVKSESVEQFAG
ncbi:hypothetical protein [Sphingomicrobium flavum]|uniref:hypothetical protein n=1 Tax=Sphingomicrobium flavum TaxID=1229164 RepID=UPI0021AE2093|nr:hypothetical protein [Sphingomicrobium flavum]